MRIERFQGPGEEWDEFVCGLASHTHFHRWGWRDIFETVLGLEYLPLAAREGNRLAGVLPLVRVKSRLFGHYLVSMPFLNYGGPLGSDVAIEALAAEAAAQGRRDGVRLVELRSLAPLPVEWPVSHRKVTVILPFEGRGSEATFGGFTAKLRSQIRRPLKAGATVRFGRDQVAPFFEVLSRHMRDLGTPTHDRRLFEGIATAFPEDAWFGCVYLDGRPAAAGAGFRWGDQFEMTWASSLRDFNRDAPNMLLYWAFMERAMEAGVARFNFGRCTPGGGTHRFKRQWGGVDQRLYWYQQAARPGAHTPSPEESRYAWGPRLWKRLPVSVATALGPRIVRGIP